MVFPSVNVPLVITLIMTMPKIVWQIKSCFIKTPRSIGGDFYFNFGLWGIKGVFGA